MEIRVLGSVEVWHGDAPVPVGGSKPHALLAALALDPGHVVSVSRLVDVVWGTDSPATATDLVQTFVSSLRRKLPGGGAVIETRPPGYVLRAAVAVSSLSSRDQDTPTGAAGPISALPGIARGVRPPHVRRRRCRG
jgi:DNA-binding SARP family transcriptional activator